MRTRKWTIYLSALVCFSFIATSTSDAFATRGNLFTDSIITCNGKTYGQHNGHWHEAKQNTKGAWYAAHPNDELTSNPCDSTFEPTGGGTTAPNENPPSTDSVRPISASEPKAQEIEEPETKEQTITEEIELRVWIENGNNPIVFSNNVYTARTRSYWQKDFNLTYQLSSKNASAKVENNDKSVDGAIKLDEGENKIKIIIESANKEDITFEINVKRDNLLTSSILLTIICVVSVAIIGIACIAIKTYVIDSKKEHKKVSAQKFFKSLLRKENIVKILLPPYYVIAKAKQHKKISNYSLCWLAIWVAVIISSILLFINNPAKDNFNINLANSPSATFTIEMTNPSKSRSTADEPSTP